MRRLFPILIIVLAVASAYGNAWQGAFQFDDYNVIVHNPVVHSWAGFFNDLPRGIRPVLKVTYTWNWVSGLGLFGFHLVNILLHAANSVLLFFLARCLLPAGSRFVALIAALLFAVHPVQTEAVTYICGRSVSLMVFFYLGSLLLYFAGRDHGSALLTFVLSPLFFLLAVLTKEVAITLPLALVLGQHMRGGGSGGPRRVFAGQGVHWGLFCCLTWFVLAHPGYGHLLETCFNIRGVVVNALTQVNAIIYLLTGLIVPLTLNIDPDLPVLTVLTGRTALEAFVLMALLAVGGHGLARRQVAGFGIVWFFLHLLPTNSLIPRLDVVNERQLYLPSWGLFLALAVGVEHLKERFSRRWALVTTCLLLVTLAGMTGLRNRVYRNEVELWEDTAKRSPKKARVLNNLGYAYELAHRLDDAENAYRRAVTLDPEFALARANLERAGAAGVTGRGDYR